MKIFYSFLFLIFSLSAFSQSKTYKVAIIHTNDEHAKIDIFPKLAAYINESKKLYDTVFVVSSGDHFSGNPIVDQYEFRGFPIIDLMNKCGYSVSAIGNHEFDYGQENLNKLASEAKFKFVNFNMNCENSVFKNFNTKTEITLPNNFKILLTSILGIEKDGRPETHPSRVEGIEFLDEKKSLTNFIKTEKTNQFFILLSHLGIEKDTAFARKIDGIDIILGGHSHSIVHPLKQYNKTQMAQAGADLKFFGEMVLEFEGEKLIKIHDELIKTDTLTKIDSEVQKIVDNYNNNEFLQATIGTFADSISGNDELGSLMCDALTNQLKCDFAFQNPGGIRISKLEKGNVSRKNIYTLDPFGNNLLVFEMTAKQIRAFIQFAYEKKENELLQVSGMTYNVVIDTEQKFKDVVLQDIKPQKTYTVVVNSYLAKKYQISYKRKILETTDKAVELLQKYIETHPNLNYHRVKRCDVVVE